MNISRHVFRSRLRRGSRLRKSFCGQVGGQAFNFKKNPHACVAVATSACRRPAKKHACRETHRGAGRKKDGERKRGESRAASTRRRGNGQLAGIRDCRNIATTARFL